VVGMRMFKILSTFLYFEIFHNVMLQEMPWFEFIPRRSRVGNLIPNATELRDGTSQLS
jgi:hypothetical protein